MSFFVNYPAWISPYVIPGGTVLRWYSMMYIFAFVTEYFLFRYALKHNYGRSGLSVEKGEDVDLLVCVFLFLILGARLGSCLIYSGTYYWTHPWLMFWPFRDGKFTGLPGMSYHGGVVGVVMGFWYYAHKHRMKFLNISDIVLCGTPFAYTFGRLGNFMNAELYGKVARSGHGMIFPEASTECFPSSVTWVRNLCADLDIPASGFVNLPRHPSQLYEALFEGLVLGVIMWFAIMPRIKKHKRGIATGSYLFLYGLFRFVIEYFRQPDSDLGYILKWGKGSGNIYVFTSLLNISMGQILCTIMMVAGLFLALHDWGPETDVSAREGKSAGKRQKSG